MDEYTSTPTAPLQQIEYRPGGEALTGFLLCAAIAVAFIAALIGVIPEDKPRGRD